MPSSKLPEKARIIRHKKFKTTYWVLRTDGRGDTVYLVLADYDDPNKHATAMLTAEAWATGNWEIVK